jgi:hypothetical protein
MMNKSFLAIVCAASCALGASGFAFVPKSMPIQGNKLSKNVAVTFSRRQTSLQVEIDRK